jgi:hypothetical protein
MHPIFSIKYCIKYLVRYYKVGRNRENCEYQFQTWIFFLLDPIPGFQVVFSTLEFLCSEESLSIIYYFQHNYHITYYITFKPNTLNKYIVFSKMEMKNTFFLYFIEFPQEFSFGIIIITIILGLTFGP